MRTEAQFTGVPRGAGHYESFYVKAAHPQGGRAVWIRHTVHKRPREAPNASLWLTAFDAAATGPRAVKATFGSDDLAAPEGAYIRIDGATLAPGRAVGSITAPTLEASWDLTFSDPGEPFHHLPYRRHYAA